MVKWGDCTYLSASYDNNNNTGNNNNNNINITNNNNYLFQALKEKGKMLLSKISTYIHGSMD